MEEITSKVTEIENCLHSSRCQLQTLETSAKKSISLEVDGIQSSLKNGYNRVEHIMTQVGSFLSQIEYVNDASTSVDMKPQVLWLHDNLQVIVSDLDTAKAKADSSIKCTELYSYKVMDVGEEVDSSSNKLTEYQNEVVKLEGQAKSLMSTSETMLEYARSQIECKEREIREKTTEAASKQQSKTRLENDLEKNRQQAARAERERKDRKEQAIAGVVCSCHIPSNLAQFTKSDEGLGVLGILAAPLTGGASLALTVGATGLAGYGILIYSMRMAWQLTMYRYKASRMDDFEKEANSYRQGISSLTTEISQNVRAVANLEHEKTRLQSLVNQYQAEVSKRQSEHHVYQRKIEQADRTKGEIATLKSHAMSTKKNVAQALPELHKIKQSLEQCSILVKERSLDVSTSSTFMERFAANLPVVGTRIKKSRDFNKQKLLLQQASETLDQIRAEVPGLLTDTGDVKFLTIKPWDSSIASVVDLGTAIPEVCYHQSDDLI